ncbi:MAG: efflux RND transporter periplasmic adaptor subunit [Phascolarctobacterium sp.]|nr:efflux RND transporter periplasmic adaptor subunit [Phascolarctobacterium sp.]
MKELMQNPLYQKRLALAAVLLAVGLGSYALYNNIAHKPQTAKLVPIVRTYTVGTAAATAAATYPGEVRGRYESQLAFQVAGKINARMVNVGDSVRAGQVLLALDPKDVNQSVEATAAQLASARASYKLAADNAARYSSLYAQGAVSEAVRDQYQTQLEAASAALRQAQAQANVSSNQLGYTQLVSDTDGVVTALNAEVGQVVAAGTPIATVVRSGEREVHISVPEGASLSVGQKAQISFWALPGVEAAGFVREIASMADPATRTYKVCVAVPDLPAAAKLGMTAKVSLAPEQRAAVSGAAKGDATATEPTSPAFTIPAQALYQVNGKTQVWVVRDNKAQLVEVKVNGYSGNEVLIEQGLSRGDKVITAGLAKLVPHQEVRLEEGGEG